MFGRRYFAGRFFPARYFGDGGTGETPPSAPTVTIVQGAATSVVIGGTRQLTVTLTGNPTPTVSWASDNEAVATVDASGLVTGVGSGTCNVTATADNTAGQHQDSIAVTPRAASTNRWFKRALTILARR